MENLAQLRDIVVAQQHAIADHRARLAHGEHMEDESGLSDEYKGGGFAGGDAKKRRGVRAPYTDPLFTMLTMSVRKLPPLADVTAATEQRHQNGVVALTEPGPCAMPVVCTTPN